MFFPRRIAAVLTMLGLIAAAAGAAAEPRIEDVRIGHHGDWTRLVLDLSAPVDFRIFALDDPHRLVVDLPPLGWGVTHRTVAFDGSLVLGLRFGSHGAEGSRVVLDLSGPVTLRYAGVIPPEGAAGHRLVIDFAPEAAGADSQPRARRADPPLPRTESAAARRAASAPVPIPRRRPGPPPRLIALDPGHGGRDPGATANGAREKDIVLQFTRELRTVLEATGRYRVVMIRDGDYYVPLRKRVERARAATADVFLSIHADHLDDRRVGGASVYTLSDKASDAEAAALAARENKSDIVADIDFSEGYEEDVTQVLISLSQQNTINCSGALAARLVTELGRVTGLVGRSHRFAGFRVLRAPDLPSVLIELGFLSNAEDAAMLRRREHRAKLASAIVTALDGYFPERC